MPKDSVTIVGMPGIWSSEISFLSSKVASSFAKWAVSQSPYVVPDNLSEAIAAVDSFSQSWGENGFVVLTCNEIRVRLIAFFESTPVIEAWNHPKNGKEQWLYGGDRYGSWQEPDGDIIDLSALARNVAHDLTLSSVFDAAHDD